MTPEPRDKVGKKIQVKQPRLQEAVAGERWWYICNHNPEAEKAKVQGQPPPLPREFEASLTS